jgi:hypothetical protein
MGLVVCLNTTLVTAQGLGVSSTPQLTGNGISGYAAKMGRVGTDVAKLAGKSHDVCANALVRYDDAMRTVHKIRLDFARLSFPATMMSTQAFGSQRSV